MSTMSECITRFKRYLETATNLLPSSRRQYISTVRRFAEDLADPQFEEVTGQDLLDWYGSMSDRGLAQGTFSTRHAAMGAFLSYLEDFQDDSHAKFLLKAMKRIKKPKNIVQKRQAYALSAFDIQMLIDAAGYWPDERAFRDKAIVHTLLATGMRRAEAASWRLDQLTLADRIGTVIGKGQKERTVVWDEACGTDLDLWLKVREYFPQLQGVNTVFLTVYGKAMAPRAIWSVVRGAAKMAAIQTPVWTHILRHTQLTRLLDQGAPLHVVSQIAGHSDPRTTMKYVHTAPTDLKHAYDDAMNSPKRRVRPYQTKEQSHDQVR